MSLDFKKEKDNDISGRNSLICATYTMIMDQGQKLKKKLNKPHTNTQRIFVVRPLDMKFDFFHGKNDDSLLD